MAATQKLVLAVRLAVGWGSGRPSADPRIEASRIDRETARRDHGLRGPMLRALALALTPIPPRAVTRVWLETTA